MGFRTSHVFRTTDAGATWSDVTGNIPDSPANGAVVDKNSGTVYVGTDVGVFPPTRLLVHPPFGPRSAQPLVSAHYLTWQLRASPSLLLLGNRRGCASQPTDAASGKCHWPAQLVFPWRSRIRTYSPTRSTGDFFSVPRSQRMDIRIRSQSPAMRDQGQCRRLVMQLRQPSFLALHRRIYRECVQSITWNISFQNPRNGYKRC